MKIEKGKTYKVLEYFDGYVPNEVFKVLSINENSVSIMLDDGTLLDEIKHFADNLKLQELFPVEASPRKRGMNLKVATARWMGTVEDLKPGDMFIYDDKIAVKMNQDHLPFEPCNCVVIGTGDNLFDFTVDEKTFNQTIVTKILLYEDHSEKG